MEQPTPLSWLYHREKTNPQKIFLKQPIDDVWHTWTWEQTGNEVRMMAAAIIHMNFPRGSHIATLSKNCAHWIITDLAIMMAGHVSVPLYPNLQANTVEQILEHSEARLLLVGKLDDWEGMKCGVPSSLPRVSFPFCLNEGCRSWEEFTAKHLPLKEDVERNCNDLCSIVYTSGTTGMPKGVMFTFASFSFAASKAAGHFQFNEKERFFSYLPLSHIAERMLVEMIGLYIGGEISFAESLQKFAKNLAEAEPTVFLGVHRIWTRFQQGILAKIPQKKLNLLLGIPVISHLVKNKIKKSLGLAATSTVLTGAAPTPPLLIKWFDKLGIRIQEAYAMTENCCYSHVTLSNNIKIGFVGQALPGCDVRLGMNDEIEIKHPAMMQGYYKDPAMTKEAFTEDGYLKTGDEGFIDEAGCLKITGRVKDIFKTAKGKYVAPSPIEMMFAGNNHLEQVCIVGSGLPQPIALITLSTNGRKSNAGEMDAGFNAMRLQINDRLDDHEKIAKIVVLSEEWTVENNLLTPSFKIKRNAIEKKYGANYQDWYSDKAIVTR
jgi:long-chain acyl-CoA synthetase